MVIKVFGILSDIFENSQILFKDNCTPWTWRRRAYEKLH